MTSRPSCSASSLSTVSATTSRIKCASPPQRPEITTDFRITQVVAPVRETAAQALAVLLPYMPHASIVQVQHILIAMIEQDGAPPSLGLSDKMEQPKTDDKTQRGKYVWQVRHSGLLGLKYLVAVKGDMLRISPGGEDVEMKSEEDVKPLAKLEEEQPSSIRLLKEVVDAALLGLRDRDDDVRSAAAATLSPIADALVSSLPAELEAVVNVLWECLGDLKDDLSSSVGGVMDLLGECDGLEQA